MPFIAGISALIIYLLTLAPDLTWANFGADGGDLITAAVTLGVPHPPGYPTYVLLGKLFSLLPIGTFAFRFNLFSAVCAAVGVGFLTAAHRNRTPHPSPLPEGEGAMPPSPSGRGVGGEGFWTHNTIIPVATALTVAFTPLVWSQSVITEVYALNFAVICALLWATQRKPFSIVLVGLLWGLSLTTHLTSVLLFPVILATLYQNKPLQSSIFNLQSLLSYVLRFAFSTAAPLLIYLIIPLLAQSGSPIRWGNPTTFDGWLWLVSARIYRPNLFGLSWVELQGRFLTEMPALLSQFAYIGWGLLIAGFVTKWRKLLPFVISASLYWVYSMNYAVLDARVYLLPALPLLSFPLFVGLRPFRKYALILPLLLIGLNFSSVSLRDGSWIRGAAETTLNTLPPNAIVVTAGKGDPSIFAMWYYHHVENQRPDIIVLNDDLFSFAWYRDYLQTQHPQLQHLAEDDLIGFTIANALQQPVCHIFLQDLPLNRCTSDETDDPIPIPNLPSN